MKIHIITIGQPKLPYAKTGWAEYFNRLKHYHQLRVTHIADRDNNAKALATAIGNSYFVALEITGQQYTSPELAKFLDKQSSQGREVSFVVGGPEGLPLEIIDKADKQLSLSKLTLPHDLAMVVLLETLYRSSTINAGLPYHK